MLATGMATLLEKQIRHTNPSRVTLWVRPELAEVCRRRIVPKLPVPAAVNEPLGDEPVLLQSGRTLFFKKLKMPDEPSVVLDDSGVVLSAFIRSPGLSPADILNRTDTAMPQAHCFLASELALRAEADARRLGYLAVA